MKNLKVRNFFGIGRKFVLPHAPKSQGIKDWLLVRGAALALFVLVFAAASVVKIQAAGNVTGWLWGGSEDGAGNNTGVGWISANNANQGGATSYGLNIPSGNGDVTGYAWSENIGWVSFNLGDLVNCPSGTCSARRNGDKLEGWARILGIKDALATGNSGGWEGWIKMSGSNYGVEISKMLGVGSGSHTYAWSNELGWIDFGQAATCTSPGCATKQLCTGEEFTTCDSSFCTGGGTCALNADQKSWVCSNGCGSVSCSAFVQSAEDGKCSNIDSFCQGRAPTNADLCAGGTSNPLASSLNLDAYEVNWDCEGICSSVNEDCSAQGTKACGWIETNP